jgi:hypothetical protein
MRNFFVYGRFPELPASHAEQTVTVKEASPLPSSEACKTYDVASTSRDAASAKPSFGSTSKPSSSL